jgi:ArsR family transcriptional regulator
MRARSKQLAVERVFRALSDRTRLRIINLLRGGELCVCEIVAVLGVPQPTASRHLAYLRKAGLVIARREGQWMHYRLTSAVSDFRSKLFECLTCCCEEHPVFARYTKRLRSGRRSHCPS